MSRNGSGPEAALGAKTTVWSLTPSRIGTMACGDGELGRRGRGLAAAGDRGAGGPSAAAMAEDDAETTFFFGTDRDHGGLLLGSMIARPGPESIASTSLR